MRTKYVLATIAVVFLFAANYTFAESVAERMKGSILLQVESKGEAWYVNPSDNKRYSLGKPAEAYELMRQKGVGITNNDLKKIPVAILPVTGSDQDGDKLSDMIETALGTNPAASDTDGDNYSDYTEVTSNNNPTGSGRMGINTAFSSKQKGKILLQVEGRGEAWYVNPKNSKRYFLGRADDAFNVMRQLGIGITNSNLNSIPAGSTPTPTPTSNTVKAEVCSIIATFTGELAMNTSDRYASAVVTPCQEQYGSLSEPLRTLRMEGLCAYSKMTEDVALQQIKQEAYTEAYNECLADEEIVATEQQLAQCKTETTAEMNDLKNIPCDDSDPESYLYCFDVLRGQELGLTSSDITQWGRFRGYMTDLIYSFGLGGCLFDAS